MLVDSVHVGNYSTIYLYYTMWKPYASKRGHVKQVAHWIQYKILIIFDLKKKTNITQWISLENI